jgi:hypothetical protein
VKTTGKQQIDDSNFTGVFLEDNRSKKETKTRLNHGKEQNIPKNITDVW